VAQFGSALHWG